MGSFVRFDYRPALNRPIFVTALPGVANVGKIAGDYLAEKLGARLFARIFSEDFPPQVMLDEESVVSLACNELWHANVGGQDIVFLRGAHQGATPESQFYLAQFMFDLVMEMDVSKIVTLGGYCVQEFIDEGPRVLGAVSDTKIKEEFSKYGVVFASKDPAGGIVGAAGMFVGLGKIYGIPSVCLMGETKGYMADPRAAIATLRILTKMLGTEIDMAEINEAADQIDEITGKILGTADAIATKDHEEYNYYG